MKQLLITNMVWGLVVFGLSVTGVRAQSAGTFTCTCSVDPQVTHEKCPSWSITEDSCSPGFTANLNDCYHVTLCDQVRQSCTNKCRDEKYPNGSYVCFWDGSACNVFSTFNCTSDYQPGNNCAELNHQDCTAGTTYSCVPGEYVCGGQNQPCCNLQACGNGLHCDEGGVCRATGLSRELCDQIPTYGDATRDSAQREKCLACYCGKDRDCETLDDNGMWTAVGCISTNPVTLVGNLITFAVSIAGGITLLLILYGAFTISTGAGNPQKLDEGKQIITAAVSGLILIILSVAILQFIGVDILKIPGL